MTNKGQAMTDPCIPRGTAPDTKRYAGTFQLRKLEAVRPPRHHPNFERAEREAARLLGAHPEATFVIVQEVARVKLKATETDGVACNGNFGTILSALTSVPNEPDAGWSENHG